MDAVKRQQQFLEIIRYSLREEDFAERDGRIIRAEFPEDAGRLKDMSHRLGLKFEHNETNDTYIFTFAGAE